MKRLFPKYPISTVFFAFLIIFTAGNIFAKSASNQVVVLIKVEPVLKLEIDEKNRDAIPQKSSYDIKKNRSPETLTYTVTE